MEGQRREEASEQVAGGGGGSAFLLKKKSGISLLRGWVLRELVFRAQQVLTRA